MFLHLSVCSREFAFPACITGSITSIRGDLHPEMEGLPPGEPASGGIGQTPSPTEKVGGTNPTGMLSCYGMGMAVCR